MSVIHSTVVSCGPRLGQPLPCPCIPVLTRRFFAGMCGGILCTLLMLDPSSAVAGAMCEGESRQLDFSGVLSQGTAEGAILRKFEATLLLVPGHAFFQVLDDPRSGCFWPESYGPVSIDNETTRPTPHLVYAYDGNLYSIPLPALMLDIPADAGPDRNWKHAGWNLRIVDTRRVDEVDCWVVEAQENRGRRQTLLIEQQSGLLVQARSDVFMGQGDQFRLTLTRTAVQDLNQATARRTTELIDLLLQLQQDLHRRPDTQLSELSDREFKTVAEVQPALHALTEGTPLQELVLRLTRDMERQGQRLAATAMRAEKLINGESPEFSLNLLNGEVIDSQSLRGKIVVLHFWDYRDQPLAEPYGQTGYLDFLFNQRKKLGVQVIGITTRPDLDTPEGLARGRRSARKLAEFMNLTYPITSDDGSLLRTLGDPRESNGQLPLWIVLTPEGKIAHYHAGFYEVDVAKGLSQLDAVISEQIRSARQ